MTASALDVSTAPGKSKALALRVFLAFLLLASPAVMAVESVNAVGPSFHGTVTNADTGAPLVGAEVWIHDAVSGIFIQAAITNIAGKYSFSVPPGKYWIDVDHPGFEFFDGPDIVYDGVDAIELNIPLHPRKPFIPIQGADRFETAVAASKRAHPAGLFSFGRRTVVIATGRNWPDALGGAALAGALEGPVLLVDTNVLPAVTLAEIARLNADKAIILGGENAVGPAVEAALKSRLGTADVTRIGGADRYVTANNVAAKVRELRGTEYDGVAFVATGGDFPDALAAAPLAAGNYWPIYLVHPTTGLSPATVAAMDGVTDAIVLGGTKAVPETIEDRLKTRLGPTNVERLWGDSRYTTAVDIAEYAVAEIPGFAWDGAGLATGIDFPDALAGGVLQGYHGRVMLLTPSNSLHPAADAALSANELQIDVVVFFGGTKALSQAVRNRALQLVGN